MATSSPTLTVCVIGQNVAGRLDPLMVQIGSIADEMIFVDGGSNDGTAAVIAKYPWARRVTRTFDRNFAKQKNFALQHARSEWILFLDTDELLGPNMLRLLPILLRSKFTGFNFPRYWLAQENPPRYVHSEKHYPDRQFRLFRNRPELRYDENRPVHEAIPLAARGRTLSLKRAHILHYCFLWEDRASRERKVAKYREANDSPINKVYLYEEQPHELKACRESFVEGKPLSGGTCDAWYDMLRLWIKQPSVGPQPIQATTQ